MSSEPPILHVCTACRAGAPVPEDGVVPGQRLFAALEHAPGLQVRPVTCLSLCAEGCAAAISAPGKWTYLLGRLRPEMADDLRAYAGLYAAASTGTVMPSRRAPSLARIIMARAPGPGQVPA